MKPSDIDYEGIEKDYRAGFLTIRQIADKYGVNKSTVVSQSKKHGWERDLTEAIKARAKAKLAVIDINETIDENVHNAVQKSVQAQKNALESAADAVAGIVLKHRKAFAEDLARAKKIEAKLDEMLDGIADAKDIAAVASTYKTMVEAKAKVMTSEAQIFDLYSGNNDEDAGSLAKKCIEVSFVEVCRD